MKANDKRTMSISDIPNNCYRMYTKKPITFDYKRPSLINIRVHQKLSARPQYMKNKKNPIGRYYNIMQNSIFDATYIADSLRFSAIRSYSLKRSYRRKITLSEKTNSPIMR